MLHIFSDFDGTITDHDTLVLLATELGGGPQMVEAIGRLLDEGKLTLRDAIAAEMRSIRAPFAEAVELLHDEVRIDPGFAPFARWCAAQAIPLTILSAGFHQTIKLFLTQDEFPGLEILANQIKPNEQVGWQCDFRDPQSDDGHDKAKAIRAARKQGRRIVFIGDGYSDRAAAEVADEVFAKHTLALYCRERGIPHREFAGFDEILNQLQERQA